MKPAVKKEKNTMFYPTLVMGVIAFVLLLLSYQRGVHWKGLVLGLGMMKQIVPILFFAFITAGLVQVLLPQEALSRWVGEGSGFKGILIGSVAGALAPGGPYVSLPLAAGFLRAGAGIGTMVAFLTGWSLWAVSRLPMELGIMGWRFTLIRLLSVLVFPPLAGLTAQGLVRLLAPFLKL